MSNTIRPAVPRLALVQPIDALESRRLLASVNVTNGTLQIAGTDAAETIVVRLAASDATQVEAVVDGAVIQTVALSALTKIEINGFGGNDSIDTRTLSLPTNLRGGQGDDTIRSGGGDDFVAGEKGDDWVYGGAGNDLITGGGQKNRLYGEDGDDKAVGGDGRDYIYGGAGKDRLYGNLGDDDIDGGGSADRLYGSSGRDLLLGGTGNDRIYGNSEADTLGGGRGRDTLIGGEFDGTDVAFTDDDDVVSQIEELR